MTFAKLLQEVEAIDGLRRIRFMTSHPKDLSDELIEVMKNSDKILSLIHIVEDLGLVLTDRNGYVYPATGQASSVLDALRFELERLKIPVLCECEVSGISKKLELRTTQGVMKADAVILAAGSKAAPGTGSDGSGYKLAGSLGPVSYTHLDVYKRQEYHAGADEDVFNENRFRVQGYCYRGPDAEGLACRGRVRP